MTKINIVFIGGTLRAKNTFIKFLTLPYISISYAIFMRGYENEKIYAEQMSQIARENNVDYVISDVVNEEIKNRVKRIDLDVIIGGGIWRSLLEIDFLSIPKYGYIALHGSSLPTYRGMAGINWQIINGEKEIKMRMFQLGSGIDNGPLIGDLEGNLLEYSIDINNDKHLDEIFEEYEKIHIQSYIDLFDLIRNNKISFYPQDESKATYACHRGKEDSEINWNSNSKEIFNLIRSQSKPYDGAYTFFNNEKVVIYKTRIIESCSNYIGRIPGKVVERNLDKQTVRILTKDSALEIIEAETKTKKNPFYIFDSVRKKCISENIHNINILMKSQKTNK